MTAFENSLCGLYMEHYRHRYHISTVENGIWPKFESEADHLAGTHTL